jgi:NADH dehydrogenase (ubiquinone) Fe-S protein 5
MPIVELPRLARPQELSFCARGPQKARMASGFGAYGHTGRCYPLFADLIRCQQAHKLHHLECIDLTEDYIECLHHRKEVHNILESPTHAFHAARAGYRFLTIYSTVFASQVC